MAPLENGIKRRHFIAALGLAVLGVATVQIPVAPPPLVFEPLAFSVRFLKAYDVVTDRHAARVDVLYGWAKMQPEFAVRLRD